MIGKNLWLGNIVGWTLRMRAMGSFASWGWVGNTRAWRAGTGGLLGAPIIPTRPVWGGLDGAGANHGPRAMESAAQNSPCGIEIQIWRTGEAGMSRAVGQVILSNYDEKSDGVRCAAPILRLAARGLLSLVCSWRYWDKGLRRPQPISRVLLFAANMAVVLGAHAAFAQSISAPQPAVHDLPAYCQRSTLTGVEFLQSIHKIIVHGDLTDIAFLEKTLGTKFSQSHGSSEDGTPDLEILKLNSNYALGSPIPVNIIIYYAKSDQLRVHQVAGLGFGSHSNFISDCYHFSPIDFSTYFSVGFYRKIFYGSPIATYYQNNNSPGKNGSKIYLDFRYGIDDKSVLSIGVGQYP